jgi:hypothetical protein
MELCIIIVLRLLGWRLTGLSTGLSKAWRCWAVVGARGVGARVRWLWRSGVPWRLSDSEAAVALVFTVLLDPFHAALGAPHTCRTLGAPSTLRPVDCPPHTLGLAELADRQLPQRRLRVGIRLGVGFGNRRRNGHLRCKAHHDPVARVGLCFWFFWFFFGRSCVSSGPASSALMVIAVAVTVLRRVFLAGAIAHDTALNVIINVQVPILVARVTDLDPRKFLQTRKRGESENREEGQAQGGRGWTGNADRCWGVCRWFHLVAL